MLADIKVLVARQKPTLHIIIMYRSICVHSRQCSRCKECRDARCAAYTDTQQAVAEAKALKEQDEFVLPNDA